MGLFEKKYCDICGKEIKFLGNRKLDDGNMCKDCASKLSPWFSGRRHTSLAAIKQQLAYREQNQTKLASFSPTKIIGKRYRFYIDENKKQFLVTSSSDWKRNNPDIISFSEVKGIDIKIVEDRDEIYDKDENGKRISFDPPQYKYEYKFNVDVDVNNEYFDDMKFELTSDRPDNPYSEVYCDYVYMCDEIMRTILNRPFKEDKSQFKYPYETPYYTNGTGNGEWYCPKCGSRNEGAFCTKCGTQRPQIFEPFFCSKCGEKITDPEAVFCPKCGNKLK